MAHDHESMIPLGGISTTTDFPLMMDLSVYKGKIIKVDHQHDSCDVYIDLPGSNIDSEPINDKMARLTFYDVPIFYHCEGSSTTQYGSSPFRKDDNVIVFNKTGGCAIDRYQTRDKQSSQILVIGFDDELRTCLPIVLLNYKYMYFSMYSIAANQVMDAVKNPRYDMLDGDGNKLYPNVEQFFSFPVDGSLGTDFRFFMDNYLQNCLNLGETKPLLKPTAAYGGEFLPAKSWTFGGVWAGDQINGFMHLTGWIENSSIVLSGTGYVVGDSLFVVQAGANGGNIRVDSINENGGIMTYTLLAHGLNYSMADNLKLDGGHGKDALFHISSVVNNTIPLQNSKLASLGEVYQVEITVLYPAIPSGTYSVSFGGYHSGQNSTAKTYSIATTTTDPLVITPSNRFNGTIIVSIVTTTPNYVPRDNKQQLIPFGISSSYQSGVVCPDLNGLGANFDIHCAGETGARITNQLASNDNRFLQINIPKNNLVTYVSAYHMEDSLIDTTYDNHYYASYTYVGGDPANCTGTDLGAICECLIACFEARPYSGIYAGGGQTEFYTKYDKTWRRITPLGQLYSISFTQSISSEHKVGSNSYGDSYNTSGTCGMNEYWYWGVTAIFQRPIEEIYNHQNETQSYTPINFFGSGQHFSDAIVHLLSNTLLHYYVSFPYLTNEHQNIKTNKGFYVLAQLNVIENLYDPINQTFDIDYKKDWVRNTNFESAIQNLVAYGYARLPDFPAFYATFVVRK